MNQPKKFTALVAFFVFCLSLTAFAQTPTLKPSEPSFDIILQTVVASNDPGRADVAPSLSGVIKKLKTDFPFSNYRLASTIFQKISNKGEFTSRNSLYLPESFNKSLFIATQLAIRGLESFVDEKGESIQIQRFEFNRIVPIVALNNVVNYEQIGFTTKLSLPKNTPTVIGSLTTLEPDELIFLILTVKSAEK